jgi:tetratricopeptide (TPR) repeat protein
MARQYDQAIEQLRNTIEMDPDFELPHLVLGQAYEQKHEYPQAVEEFKKAGALSHESVPAMSALGHVYAVTGRRVEAQRVLQGLLEESKKQYVSPFYIAIVYAGMSENQKAIDWLESAYKDRSNGLVFAKVDPELDPLRSDSRFQALLQHLNLPK